MLIRETTEKRVGHTANFSDKIIQHMKISAGSGLPALHNEVV
jgi:hypothetical protein